MQPARLLSLVGIVHSERFFEISSIISLLVNLRLLSIIAILTLSHVAGLTSCPSRNYPSWKICWFPLIYIERGKILKTVIWTCLLFMVQSCRPRWSRGNVLASRSMVRWFKPDWGRWIFSGRKNPEHKSSRRDVKLLAPSLRFQAR